MKIFLYELDKTVIKNKGILLIFLAFLLKLIILGTEVYAVNPFTAENRAQYLPIVNVFSGKITPALSTAIEKQYTAVTEAQVKMIELRQKYNRGEVTEFEYLAESRTLEKLINDEELFLTFYSQYTYAREDPEKRSLLYDDGWNAMLDQERFDWGYVLLTIVLAASVFGREYEADMRILLIATQKGDIRLIAAKFASLFAIVVLCSLIASLEEYLFFSLKFGLPHGDYPLQSLYYFKDSVFHGTLLQTYLCISAYRMFGLLMLAAITMFISVMAQKTIVTLSTSLMVVVLPYAIPIKASAKYILPSPLGFILAQGFFRGTQMNEQSQVDEALFSSISHGLQVGLLIGWGVAAVVMLYIILRKFLAAKSSKSLRKKRWFALVLLLLLLCLAGCSPKTNAGQKLDHAYNMAEDRNFVVVNNEIVTLLPTFLMENMQTHEISDVIRDPFADTSMISNRTTSVFNGDGKLDYLEVTDDELKIVELDLLTYKTSILFDEFTPKNPALINSDLEVHKWGIGAPGYFFFVNGDDIFIQSSSNLRKINRITRSDEIIIKNVYSGHLAFDGQNIYYVNTIFEIRAYNIASGENKPLPNIRADALYFRGSKIYYRNVDEDGIIYVYDISTQQNKAVIPNRAYFFACDDDFLYYTNQEDHNYLYRADLRTGISELIAPLNGFSIHIIEGYPFVYYSVYGIDFASEIYRINKQTLSYEKIEYPKSE